MYIRFDKQIRRIRNFRIGTQRLRLRVLRRDQEQRRNETQQYHDEYEREMNTTVITFRNAAIALLRDNSDGRR